MRWDIGAVGEAVVLKWERERGYGESKRRRRGYGGAGGRVEVRN